MEITEKFLEERRLHPMTLAYRAIINLPGFLIPFYIVYAGGNRQELFYLFLAVLIGLLTFPGIFLTYYYFRFFITKEEIIIRSGVLSRKQRNIPIKRIQNVGISRNFLQRALGLAKVKLETAGDIEAEGSLEFVSKDNAEEIRAVVHEYQIELQNETEETAPEKDSDVELEEHEAGSKQKASPAGEKLLFSLRPRELLIYGMMNFRPVVLIAAFTVIQYINFIPDSFEEIQKNYLYEFFTNSSPATIAVNILLILALTFVSSWLIDIFLTANKYYGFKLYRHGSKLQAYRGLLSKNATGLPLKKLQSMVINSNFITRKFNYYGLSLQTAGFGANENTAEAIVPIAKFDEIISLSKQILEYTYPEEFKNVSKLSIRRAFVRYFIRSIPFAVLAYFFFQPALWAFVLTPLLWLAAYVRWKYRKYSIQDNYVIIMQGYIKQKISIIPVEKFQTLNIVRTFFQRRLGLSSLNVDTAGAASFKDASIVDIMDEEAEDIALELNEAFIRKTKSG